MKKDSYRVAVVGASGLVGTEILSALADRVFPVAELNAYSTLSSIGEEVTCGAATSRLAALDAKVRFDGVDVAFFAAGERVSAEWAERAAAAGAVVIDLTGLFAEDPSVPIVVPEVNAADVGSFGERRLIVSPDSVSIAMAVALSPLRDLATVRRVVATSFEPVSGAGRDGVAELERQTLDLMSGREPDCAVFPQRIAFNVLPQVGEFLAGGMSRGEQLSAAALRRLLRDPQLPISVTRVRVPTFFGLAVSVNVELSSPLPEGAVGEKLRQSPGILVLDDANEPLYPTPAESIGNDVTYVGRVRHDPRSAVLDLWLSIDNVRKGSAVNAVQIAEILVRDHL